MVQGQAALAAVDVAHGCAGAGDLSLRGLVLLAQFHGIAADAEQLAHEQGCAGEAFDETSLLLAARRLGLKAKVVDQPVDRIGLASLPAMAMPGDGVPFRLF